MLFRDRQEAGVQLAQELANLAGTPGLLVLAIPRGGVVVANQVARALKAPLDVIITRKIGAPFNEELALGAITPSGEVLLDKRALKNLGLAPRDLAGRVEEEKRELLRRMKRFRGDRPFPEIEGRTVIVVDDGIATGLTVKAAIDTLRQMKAGRIILAVPVAPLEVVEALSEKVDHLTCLKTPEPFYAVGQFYRSFEQVSDAEVVRILAGEEHNVWGAGELLE